MILSRSTLSFALAVLPLIHAAVHEKLATTPGGWTYASTPDQGQLITLTIGLQQQNLDQLQSLLASVSTPGSPSYGRYFEKDDIDALLAPPEKSVNAVLSWLKQAGINATDTDGKWIDVKTSVGTANSLFEADFINFEDTTGASKLRTLQYSIPDGLYANVDLVHPTTYSGRTSTNKHPRRQLSAMPESASLKTENKQMLGARQTPAQINTTCFLYNIPESISTGPDCLKPIYNIGYTPDAASGSRVGFGSFLNQSALYTDQFQYEKKFDIPFQNFTVVLINGGTNNQDPANATVDEGNLDAQTIVGISHPLPLTELITGGSPPFVPDLEMPTAASNGNEPYLQYYQHLLSHENSKLPQVISNSYGEPEQTVPERYAKRVCNMIGQMGLRGITVLEASGDTGVGSTCMSNDGKNTTQFTPNFPGSCPYITSVGGTQSLEPEVAWTNGSGGFSNYWGRAWYQESAVKYYLSHEISNSTKAHYNAYTNFSGRGFPDVSAHSLIPYYQIIMKGDSSASGGTSAAAPVWAGVVALLNDARLRAGQPAMGFLNPWLYSVGYKGLTDITLGGAMGCNGVNGQTGVKVPGGGIIPYASWNATVGWDPVTGLGVPNFGKLIELALAM